MIPAIGFMIGFYIVSKMVTLLTRKNERSESNIAKLFAAIALIVAIICMLDLYFSGASIKY